MKKIFLLIMISLFMVVSNATGADLNGCWYGSIDCSDGSGDQNQTVKILKEQDVDFFTVMDSPEKCGGVVEGNKFYMTCDGFPDSTPSFAYGEIKGKILYVINHVPADGKTCKGIYNKVSCQD